MRCKSCNEVLSDWEATRKIEETEEYLELCNQCFDDNVLTIDRPDLMHIEDEKPGLDFEELDEYDLKSLGINDIYYDQ
jgi:NAD-dependent SIR2 family protein deacetylase